MKGFSERKAVFINRKAIRMSDATIDTETPTSGMYHSRGPSVRTSLLIALLGIIALAIATALVMRNAYSVLIEAFFALLGLAGFGITAYGLIQAVLAVVDSAGERRRQEREVSERRTGERARTPLP
jgi:hypothetical protein